MQKTVSSNSKTLFKTPFSKAYWMQAASEMKNPQMLVFAALTIALRVALKAVKIPIAASIDINTAFIVNAFGAMVYGPVVALMGAAISDTLGALLIPSGPYFFPFIFTEMAGSLIFALFLYRTEVSILRLLLSRFCICFFVNIMMTEPIMIRYYELFMTSFYTPFQTVRIVKNMVLFPVEAVILAVIFRGLIPPFRKMGYLYTGVDHLTLTKKHIVLLVALFIIGASATAGYIVYDYNNKSFSASYSAAERLAKNKEMNRWAAQELSSEEDSLVTVIQSARSKVGDPQMTYEIIVYCVDQAAFNQKALENPAYTLDTLLGYSKSKAKADEVLIPLAEGTAITNKHTGEHLSISLKMFSETEEDAKAK